MATTTTPRTTTRQPSRQKQAAPVPLAVWPVGQRSAQYQRAGRYHPDCAAHPGKMLPDLASQIVVEYSQPGSLVVDPMAGTGTTLIEAALAGRRAIGVELEARWADLARANADHVLDPDTRKLVEVHQGDATKLAELLGPDAGRVDLVCTSPPYACDVGNLKTKHWGTGHNLCSVAERNYSGEKANLGHARGAAYEAAMAAIYAACLDVLRPGGILAVVTKNTRRKGRTLDLAGLTVALAEAAGFTYLQHVVALHAAVRDDQLVGRPSFWQTLQLRKAHERGEPAHLVVHEDIEVLQAPMSKETARAR
ncbi:MAG: TRM11 family SAM-dependent methyltransferase [Acidimicrobiales bacterium]